MPAKKAAAKTKTEPTMDSAASKAGAADAPEPGDVNSALDSDRMRALLEDHRKMGARP